MYRKRIRVCDEDGRTCPGHHLSFSFVFVQHRKLDISGDLMKSTVLKYSPSYARTLRILSQLQLFQTRW